jgi:5'-nucleotidase
MKRVAAVSITLFLFVSINVNRADERLHILLSNDDGYGAPGLTALVDALSPAAEITVVAPATEQSAKGHSLITRDPIQVSEFKQPSGSTWYSVEGPPATCVRLALEALMPQRPDLVVSGINRGENLGTIIYCSGTVAGAREAAIVGIPALAVSIGGNDSKDYAAAAAFIRSAVLQMRDKQMLKPGLFLNVNVPAGERKGVRMTRLGMKSGGDVRFERRLSPGGRTYFWNIFRQIDDDVEGTDIWAFFHGYIAVTPMALDVTSPAFESFPALKLP